MVPRGPDHQLSGETEKGYLIGVRNLELKIPSPLGPGVLRVKERNVKRSCDSLSFRREK